MGCCLTSWFSKKQTALAISTTEAEYVSAGKACQQAIWMKQALVDYGVKLDDILIMCDNKGVIDLSLLKIVDFLRGAPTSGQEHAAVAQSQPSSSTPQLGDGFQTNQADHGKCHSEVSQEGEEDGGFERRKLVLTDSEEEETEAQGRKSQDDPLDSSVQGLVTPSSTRVNASGEEQEEDISPNTLDATKTLSKVASLKTRSIDKGRRYKRRKEAKEMKVLCRTFQEDVMLIKLNTGDEKLSTGNEQVSTVGAKKSTSDQDKGQREGKSPMISEETPKKSKEQVLQEEIACWGVEANLGWILRQRNREKRKAQVQFEAQHYTNEDWDFIRAKLEANAELSKSMLGSETQGEDFAKKMVDLVNQRKKYFAEQRVKAKRNKPMPNTLKHYDEYLKNQRAMEIISAEEFDIVLEFGEELQTKTPKRLKDDKDDEAKDDEQTKKSGKRRKQQEKGLHTTMKTPSIATYKIIKQGEKGAYQIVREDGTDIVYINFGAMMKSISRDDLTELYRIVMNRYGMNGPEDELERVFWNYLKNMFEEPLSTASYWREVGPIKEIIKAYPLSAEICKAMLDKKLQGGKPDENCYKMLKMMEKQAGH
ncbi:hypothetical protein Tco_0863128 [Tanacetum coccineum]